MSEDYTPQPTPLAEEASQLLRDLHSGRTPLAESLLAAIEALAKLVIHVEALLSRLEAREHANHSTHSENMADTAPPPPAKPTRRIATN